ncbi:MAG TPA: ABC transporter substrate-binding protein [Stellaceae bacterium]|jgi:NitT/TauT family transport system substrate-binding protein|nr:ABC transporter substrate-binding protein [Stellaceae bacterium]
MRLRRFAVILLLGGILAGTATKARAEADEIRLAKQFSMGYVQFDVLEHRHLIEKYANAAGLGDIKVVWATFNGPNMMNDALLAGSVDIVAGGVPGLVTLWAKTKGTAEEVRGISALSSQPFLLNTSDPRIRSVRDFRGSDRIALPAIKVSVQAVTLEMAAAEAFGQSNYAKLDPLTLSLSPPDATTALLAGGAEFSSVFSVPPFQQEQLRHPGIHTVLSSFDVLGGAHSFTVAWTTRRFHDENPKLYGALVAALTEATRIINADKRAAAALWIEDARSKLPLDMVSQVIAGPQATWTMTPQQTMKFAQFMQQVGSIKAAPASWKALFFPEIYNLPGS